MLANKHETKALGGKYLGQRHVLLHSEVTFFSNYISLIFAKANKQFFTVEFSF
jgi:hypothetical protein